VPRHIDVLVPMKPLSSAKSRLSPAVPDGRRQAAALFMLGRVLEAASSLVGTEHCQVIGGDQTVRQITGDTGCRWARDQGYDLNSSLWLAMEGCFQAEADAVIFLPGDLPLVTSDDVAAVIAASLGLMIPAGVAALGGGGTNALLMPSALAFRPALGHSSFVRHQALAQALGTTLVSVEAAGLVFDVDTPEDFEWAVEHVPGFAAGLSREELRFQSQTTAGSTPP
jgi:2-phospho-L-lactate guanylyltransferase